VTSSSTLTIRLDIGDYLPIGDPLEQSLYRQQFSGQDLDISGSRDVIGQVTIWFPGGHFL